MFLPLSKRLLTAALFALAGWWEIKCKCLSVCIGFLKTVTLRVLSSLHVRLVSRKGREPGIFLQLHGEFDGGAYLVEMAEQGLHSIPLHFMQHVSSTYHFQNLGLEGTNSRASSSKNSMYRLATTAETGEPMAAPSLCS